jgi:hypothetical protein
MLGLTPLGTWHTALGVLAKEAIIGGLWKGESILLPRQRLT